MLSPAGRLRLELSPTIDLWSRRYGLHEQDGARVEAVEPLGFDLERAPLDVAALETGLREALEDPSLPVVLGSARALVSRDRTRLALGAALGITDWLTIGAVVPLVKPRTEVAFDFRSGGDANLGQNPRLIGDNRVEAFLGELAAGRSALQAEMDERCPADPACAALGDLLSRYSSFASGLRSAYQGSPLFVTSTSTAGKAIQARLVELKEEVAASAPDVAVPTAAPMPSSPLDQEGMRQLLVDPVAGYRLLQPIEPEATDWLLGDVEVSLALRLFEGAARDSSGAARFRYLLGVQGLARLPTGQVDHPDIPLDFGSGDGQLDLEGGAFADLRSSRVGLRGEVRYGVQGETDLVRRVAPPEVVFAPVVTREMVRWTPGSYLSLEAAPSWYLADEFALGATYRLWRKQADRYVRPVQDDVLTPGTYPVDVLARETEETLHEIGLGLAFSTLTSWREGRASLPFEVRLAVRRGIAGSGGAVPKGTRLEATGRVFWRLWGAEPERAAGAS